MLTPDTVQQDVVTRGIKNERSSLFRLTDHVLESEHPYDMLAVDALSGYFVGQFLGPVLNLVNARQGKPEPAVVNIALSTKARPYGKQKEAVEAFISTLDVADQDVLLTTETRHNGRHLSLLARYFIAAGARLDVAVLANCKSDDPLPAPLRKAQPDARVFVGRSSILLPEFFSPLGSPLREATGLEIVSGEPQPIENPNARPSLVAAGHTAIGLLAGEYIGTRLL